MKLLSFIVTVTLYDCVSQQLHILANACCAYTCVIVSIIIERKSKTWHSWCYVTGIHLDQWHPWCF